MGYSWFQYWMFGTTAATLFGTIQAYYSTELLAFGQFSNIVSQITPLAGRLFGNWTLLATAVRLAYGLDPANKTLYYVTLFSFILALGFYQVEFWVIGSVPLFPNLIAPMLFAVPSLLWLLISPPYLTHGENGKKKPTKAH